MFLGTRSRDPRRRGPDLRLVRRRVDELEELGQARAGFAAQAGAVAAGPWSLAGEE